MEIFEKQRHLVRPAPTEQENDEPEPKKPRVLVRFHSIGRLREAVVNSRHHGNSFP